MPSAMVRWSKIFMFISTWIVNDLYATERIFEGRTRTLNGYRSIKCFCAADAMGGLRTK